jgi:hypothetical protein
MLEGEDEDRICAMAQEIADEIRTEIGVKD